MIRSTRRRAFTLLAVLVVLAMLAYGGYALSRTMREEAMAATQEAKRAQCRQLAFSGVALVDALRSLDEFGVTTPLGDPLSPVWRGVSVRLDFVDSSLGMSAGMDPDTGGSTTMGSNQGRFAILAPPTLPDSQDTAVSPGSIMGSTEGLGPPTGSRLEGGRVHLNHWAVWDPVRLNDFLLTLPNASPELVDAVLDWLDSDSVERAAGAESEYYQGLPVPIEPRNGPIGSIEELLLVKGMTPEILFGDDRNRNGQPDHAEASAGDAASPSADLGAEGEERFPGWVEFLTLDSVEPNWDADRQPRIFLNDPDLGRLYTRIAEEFSVPLAQYVLAYRWLGAPGAIPLMAAPTDRNRFHFRSPAELIDGSVQSTWKNKPVSFPSPITLTMTNAEQEIGRVLDRFTTRTEPVIVGRLDLRAANTATIRLLTNLTEEEQAAILENRPAPPNPADSPGAASLATSFDPTMSDPVTGQPKRPRSSLAWLLASRVLSRDQFIAIEPLVTVHSTVVRFQTIGFLDRGRQSARFEIVADLTGGRSAMVVRRSWSLDRWGGVIPLESLGQGGESVELPTLGMTQSP